MIASPNTQQHLIYNRLLSICTADAAACAQLYRRRADVVLCSAAVFVGLIKHIQTTPTSTTDISSTAFVRWRHCLAPVIV